MPVPVFVPSFRLPVPLVNKRDDARKILSGPVAVIELAKSLTFHEEEHCHEHHAALEDQLGADAPEQLAAQLSTRSRRSSPPTRGFSERTGSSPLRTNSCVRSSVRLATLSIG